MMNCHSANLSHHSVASNINERKVAEIVVARDHYQNLLMPIIATFSHHDKRWLTWITYSVPSKDQLLAYGVNLRALRLIYINRYQDNRWLVWEALAQGNSHTVVSELGRLTSKDMSLMEGAAVQGSTQGIIIKRR